MSQRHPMPDSNVFKKDEKRKIEQRRTKRLTTRRTEHPEEIIIKDFFKPLQNAVDAAIGYEPDATELSKMFGAQPSKEAEPSVINHFSNLYESFNFLKTSR